MKLFAVMLKSFSLCALLFLSSEVAYAGNKSQSPRLAEDVVKMLYHDYAWEALSDKLGKTALEQQSVQELEKYFDSSLAKMVKKDQDCVEKTEEICQLDFKIIFGSQDPAAFDLEVSSMNKKNEINVQFKHPSNRQVIRLVYKMINTASGWKIHDIEYPEENLSLRALFE